MTSEPKRSSYLVAEASPAEMAQQWRHVEARIERGPGRRRWLPLSLALAGGAAAIVVLASSYRAAPERAWTSQGEPMPVALADGSRLELRPGSQVSLLGERKDEVRLGVLRGGARFEVRPDPGRRFQVTAAGVDVVVTGTAFSVELESGQGAPRVSVERGEVEVHPRGETRLLARLHADESWPTRPAPSVAPAAPPVPAATPPVETRPEPAGPAPPLVATPASAPAGRRPAPTDPRLLLEEANTARRIGDVERAAALLETLRVRHPRDPRAALATFELGRLRMDALGDLEGAVQALKHSIMLAPAGVFREDAEACLATAYARMRDRPRCENARQTYLGHYPDGTHAAAVSALACQAR
jgi:transmembrane sensor